MKKIIMFGLSILLVSWAFAQDPDVGGEPLKGAPFSNGSPVSFTILAGASGGPLTTPSPGGGVPFTVTIGTKRIANIVITASTPNYFDIDIQPVSTATNGKLYTITFTQNQSIPVEEYTEFKISGTVEGTAGQEVSYQANGDPGGYASTNKGTDDPSSKGTIVAVLPVTLVSFSATTPDGKTSYLSWQTASELNNDRFEVERSADGTKFTKIGMVKGKGTTGEAHQYSLTDGTPMAGINYYRLKQVDIDGKYNYTEVRTVSFGNGRLVKAYPNPVKTQLMVQGLKSGDRLDLYNAAGALISTTNASGTQQSIDMSQQPSGTYLLKIVNKNILITSIKLNKEKN